ncbi:MAG: DASS family sodium-coupled anion symporter [Alphaproteobacteria bacterium]|nr:DASS family sodium-coupled anion symporter [Alphaproteobacteria bacterium]
MNKIGTRNFNMLMGMVLFTIMILLPAPARMSASAWSVAAVTVLLAYWWSSEALPVPITSLLPIVLFPTLGVSSIGDATAPYAAPTIFLLMGGFIMATGLARWNLHRRIALMVLVRVGNNPTALIGGFMTVTALISMWISNTASTLMMLPIALSLASEIIKEKSEKNAGFILCLVLGIAYGANIGGFGTPIGTPPNLLVIAFMKENYGIDVSFLSWMLFGVPATLVMLPIACFVLTRWAFPFELDQNSVAQELLHQELKEMGPMSTPEKRMAYTFAFIAALWIFRTPIQNNLGIMLWLSDALISIFGAMIMFMIPAGSKEEQHATLLNWKTADTIPWGVLLLFGGGLSLAAAVKSSGLALWIGNELGAIGTFDLIFIIFILVSLVVFLTELTSNTATTATLLPILGALAVATGLDPMILFVPVAISASCAFMLPVATAPNAVIYASGEVTIPQMAFAGFRVNLFAIVAITSLSYFLVPIIFG